MGRCVIVCAGEFGAVDFVPRFDDFVICCDAGLLAAQRMGLTPDLLMGDFDSYGGALPDGVEIRRFPVEKDDTDSMLAVREGLSRGMTDFVLLCALGGRLDHAVANIQTLAFLGGHGANGMLCGSRDAVRMVTNAELTLPQKEGYTLSVFAYGQKARGVTLEGVQYPLCDAELIDSFPLGLGNHITADAARIRVTDGTLLVICSSLE